MQRTSIARDAVRRSGDFVVSGGGVVPPPGSTVAGVFVFDSIHTVGLRLDAFVSTGQPKGTLAYVGNDTFAGQGSVHRYYTLVYGENLVADGIEVVNSSTFGVDGAQWLSQDTMNQQALQKLFWAVDPANVSGIASDENSGFGISLATARLTPLRTFQELNRRLFGYNGTTTVQIAVMSSDTNTPIMSNLAGATGSEGTGVVGDLVQLGADYVVTTYLPANPAANLSFFIIAPGLGAAGNLGKLVTNAAQNKWAMIQAVDGVNQAEVTQPHNYNPFTFGGGTSGISFVAGETVRVWNMPSLSQWPFPGRMQFPVAWHVQLNGNRTPPSNFDITELGDSAPQITACIIDGWQVGGGKSGNKVGCQFAGHNSIHVGGASLSFFNCGVRNVQVQLIGGSYQIQNTINLNGAAAVITLANGASMNCVANSNFAAYLCNSGAAIDMGRGTLFFVSDSSALYGNSVAPLIRAAPACRVVLTKALCFALTAAPGPLLEGVLSYQYADLPFQDLPLAIFFGIN